MLEKIEKFVASVCVVVMAILVFANVIARKAFEHYLVFMGRNVYLFVCSDELYGYSYCCPAPCPLGLIHHY